jgi:hypothetical protein
MAGATEAGPYIASLKGEVVTCPFTISESPCRAKVDTPVAGCSCREGAHGPVVMTCRACDRERRMPRNYTRQYTETRVALLSSPLSYARFYIVNHVAHQTAY